MSEERPSWLTPLLVLSVLILISVLVAAPIKRAAVQMNMGTPENFQYYSEDQQSAIQTGQANQTSPLFLFVFPLLSGLAGLWVSWFLLSSLLHLSLTLSGSRAKNVRSYNLAGWSYLPIGIRYLVQIIAMIFTKKAITTPGLSGFISADATGFTGFIACVLALIDLYFIWQIVLLLIGVIPLSNLSKTKAWTATGISVLILIVLQSLPGVISKALSGLSLGGGFFF